MALFSALYIRIYHIRELDLQAKYICSIYLYIIIMYFIWIEVKVHPYERDMRAYISPHMCGSAPNISASQIQCFAQIYKQWSFHQFAYVIRVPLAYLVFTMQMYEMRSVPPWTHIVITSFKFTELCTGMQRNNICLCLARFICGKLIDLCEWFMLWLIERHASKIWCWKQ